MSHTTGPCAPRRPVLHLLVSAFLAVPAAALGAGRPHASIAWPRRDVEQSGFEQTRRKLAARRAEVRSLLDGPGRASRIHERGLLTNPAARAPRAPRYMAADTLDVLLVRVGFAANRAPHLTSMDPSGDFRFAEDRTAVVDPPPHDADYFAAHLLAQAAYYRTVSSGQLELRGTVFPPQGEASIKLGDPADYGPGQGGRWTLELLEAYFRAAVSAFDSAAAGRLDCRDYESFVFVHPGSDLQSDINRDSPNDLPTFFVTLLDPASLQDGDVKLQDGLVLPEQLSQDGFLGSIQGGLCHEFGHQLGLPDWYDTVYGLPAVGEWDLLDSGNTTLQVFQVQGSDEIYAAWGMVPAGLSVLSRYLLSWEEPVRLRAPEDSVVLRPSLTAQGAGPRSARLDVSPDEYFLVENRRDMLAEHLEDTEPCPYLNQDDSTGVVLWMSRDDPDKPSRERRNSGEYDFFISSPTMPEGVAGPCGDLGFGVLVWHVDERRLAEGYAYNEVNGDELRRALRLVEASGDFEIGDWRMPTRSFAGDGWNDPFREGYKTALTSTTVPNNWSNDWAQTGWEITDIRFAAPESHTLRARVQDGIAGWPRVLRTYTDTLPPVEPQGAVVARLGGVGIALVVADSIGLGAWGPDGTRLRLFDGPLAPASLAYHPALAAGDSVGTIACVDAERVWLFDARLEGGQLAARPGFPLAVPGGTGGRLVLRDAAHAGPSGPGVIVETGNGAWLAWRADGIAAGSFDVDRVRREAAVVAGAGLVEKLALVGGRHVVFPTSAAQGGPVVVAHGLDAADTLLAAAGGRMDPNATTAQVVVLRSDGALRVVDPERGVLPGFRDLPRDTYTGLALADVNGDGELDIVAASPTRLAGVTSRGARLLDTPRALQDVYAVQDPVRITTGPLVADVAGDSLPEILVTTDLGLVYALDAGGRPVPGFPRKLLPDLWPAALLAADVDGDGAPEVIGVSPISAAAVAPAGGSTRAGWIASGGDMARTSFAATPAPVQVASRIRQPERAILAYPNPAREGLVWLRMTAERDGPYAVAIYNLEGEKVFETSGTLAAHRTQEVAWRCPTCAPGVYLCRFVSAAAGVPKPRVDPITLLR